MCIYVFWYYNHAWIGFEFEFCYKIFLIQNLKSWFFDYEFYRISRGKLFDSWDKRFMRWFWSQIKTRFFFFFEKNKYLKMSIVPKEAIEVVAQSIGITNLSPDVALALAPDVEYRVREIMQVCAFVVKFGINLFNFNFDIVIMGNFYYFSLFPNGW